MTQDYSTAHTFHYRWFVQLDRIHSNLRLVSKPDTAWYQTHSLKVQLKVLEESLLVLTVTTEELRFKTLCKVIGIITFRPPHLRGSFFVLL